MKKLLITIPFLILYFISFANGIQISPQSFECDTVIIGSEIEIIYTISNTSNSTTEILNIKYLSPDISHSLDSKYISPNSQTILKIIFTPPIVGMFYKSIQIVTAEGMLVVFFKGYAVEGEQSKHQETIDTGFTFRNSLWGMTKDEVLNSEKLPDPINKDDIIGYSSTIAGFDCFIFYIFIENKLVRSKYVFTQVHSNENDFISDYYSLKNILKEKYHDPSLDKIFWKNDLYKNDHDQWGFAISLGHLSYYSVWVTSRTKIYLYLTGENYKTKLEIEYVSIDLLDFEKEKKKEKVLEDF
ncbi:MAG: hypothetical protein HN691_04955 [Bacteroidetes bacterium]|nr:hypothetical protein [Bacteroidota bacterium]